MEKKKMIEERESMASSIGIIGEPYLDRRNNRVKGFCERVVVSRNLAFAEEFIAKARNLADESSVNRITLRMISEGGLKIRVMPEEARIPLKGRWAGYDIVYLGENSSERKVSLETLSLEDQLLAQAKKHGITNPLRRVEKQGYSTGIEMVNNSKDICQIYDIYKEAFSGNQAFSGNGNLKYTFELTEESIEKLLSLSTTVVARDIEGKIVSIIVGEVANVMTDLRELRICEYSDEATLKAHRKQGLSQACLWVLSWHLFSKGIDLIYGEARACHIGANVVPAKLGFSYGGRLIRHCVIGGDSEIKESYSPYENLNVWYQAN